MSRRSRSSGNANVGSSVRSTCQKLQVSQCGQLREEHRVLGLSLILNPSVPLFLRLTHMTMKYYCILDTFFQKNYSHSYNLFSFERFDFHIDIHVSFSIERK